VTALSRLVAGLSRLAVALGSMATVTCLFLVGYSVVMRYAFGAPQPWIDKVAGWLVLGLVMLAAPEAQRRFEHIGVDVAVSKLGPGMARAAHLIGTLSVAAVAAVLVHAGWEAIEFSLMVGMMTDIEGVPEWWIQLLLPVGAGLLLLVALVQSLMLALGGTPEHLPTGDEELPRDTLARGE
jgi:TRAP-type C4-dicarboxylate transport system permease small subunit